jgi:hypothetical protein
MKTNNNKFRRSSGISRRNFVKTAASGAAALTILPNFTVAGLGHVAQMISVTIQSRPRKMLK